MLLETRDEIAFALYIGYTTYFVYDVGHTSLFVRAYTTYRFFCYPSEPHSRSGCFFCFTNFARAVECIYRLVQAYHPKCTQYIAKLDAVLRRRTPKFGTRYINPCRPFFLFFFAIFFSGRFGSFKGSRIFGDKKQRNYL